jgi:hypothetical protein
MEAEIDESTLKTALEILNTFSKGNEITITDAKELIKQKLSARIIENTFTTSFFIFSKLSHFLKKRKKCKQLK